MSKIIETQKVHVQISLSFRILIMQNFAPRNGFLVYINQKLVKQNFF